MSDIYGYPVKCTLFLCIQEVILLKGEAAKVAEGQQISQCAPRLKIINELTWESTVKYLEDRYIRVILFHHYIISTLTCLHHSLQALSSSVFVFC